MLLERLSPKAAVAAALAAGLTFQLLLGTSYVAAFLDPVAASTGVPVALVDLDAGERGREFAERLAGAESPVAWIPVASRDEAVRGLVEKRYAGALVIPANFSDALDSFAGESPRAALLEAFTNPGASTTGSLVSERVMGVAVERLRAAVRERALEGATVAGGIGLVTVDQARFLADPVKVRTLVMNPVTPDGVNGLAPTALAMAAWIGGYFGAVALERFRDTTRLTAPRRALVLAAGALAQAGVAVVAVAAVGLSVPDAVLLWGILAVGTWMAYAVVNLLLDLLGLAGVIPAFALLAIGLPASGGIYPPEMMSPIYRAIHAWNPFTWLVEALRTALYAPEAGDVGAMLTRLALVGAAATAASLTWGLLRRGRAAPSRAVLTPTPVPGVVDEPATR